MNDKVPVFAQRRAGVYLLSEIYNPDNVSSSVQNVAKAIPAVGSLVIDDSVGQHNTLYVVYAVDAVTYKASLVPAVATTADADKDAIITYGNNVYMMYYKSASMALHELTTDTTFQSGKTYYTRSGTAPNYTYTVATVIVGNVVAPNTYYENVTKTLYECVVDNKISIFGDVARTYSIFKGNNVVEGSTLPLISNYYVNDNNQVVEASRIPMDLLTVPTMDSTGTLVTAKARVPRICYSATSIETDQAYTIVVYDTNGLVIGQIVLLGHQILGISSLASVQWPITSFYATANQYDTSDHKCYLTRGQNVDELIIYPHITYANGDTVSEAGIDSTKLFIYGKEEISTAVPGSEYQILLKYYLGNNESTSETRDYRIGETARYIYTSVTVKIISALTSGISKISPIVYETTNATGFNLFPLVYYKNKQAPTVATNSDAVYGFSGAAYSVYQNVRLRAYETLAGSSSAVDENYKIAVFNPSDRQTPFCFRKEPSTQANYYGENTVSAPRPRITHTSQRAVNQLRVTGADIDAANGLYTATGSLVNNKYAVYTNGTYYIGARDLDRFQYLFVATPPPSGGYNNDVTYIYRTANLITSGSSVSPEVAASPAGKAYYKSNNTETGITIAFESSTNTYQIPAETFTTKELFLTSFYYRAEPPVEDDALVPTIPTHFIIRKIASDGTIPVITVNPISVDDYDDPLSLLNASQLDDATGVIMEFLYHTSSMGDTYDHLFGVPVPIEHNITTTVLITVPMFISAVGHVWNPMNVHFDVVKVPTSGVAPAGQITFQEYLPSGFSVQTDSPSGYRIVGTATTGGIKTGTIVASAPGCEPVVIAVTLDIRDSITINTLSPMTILVGQTVNLLPQATTSGQSVVTLTKGSNWPSELSLASTHAITGSFSTTGTYVVNLNATAEGCDPVVDHQFVTITVTNGGTITIPTPYGYYIKGTPQPGRNVGAIASNGNPVSYTADWMPAGMTLASDGFISGTCTQAKGDYITVLTMTAVGCPTTVENFYWHIM